MSKVIFTRGIPASGKSTWAKQFVAESPGWIRTNRDDIRFSLYGTYWGGNINEDLISAAQVGIIQAALRSGNSVVIDNTNLKHAYINKLAKAARQVDPEVEFDFENFEIELGTALVRDSKRTPRVGERVIRDFFRRYTRYGKLLPPPKLEQAALIEIAPYLHKRGLPKAVLVDIDGTLADMGDRNPYDESRYAEDRLHSDIASLVDILSAQWYEIIIMSGRDEAYREVTETWLHQRAIPFNRLYMRPQGDRRKDWIVKNELFDEHIMDLYNVDYVFDDRDQVVQMWRKKGLRCLQVADGNF